MNKKWPLLGLVFVFALTGAAHADGIDSLQRLIGAEGDSKSVSRDENAGILRLTPDKTHVLRLERDAASVIVANPEHAGVMLDSPRLLIIMPRQPGTTSFTVLDARGESLLEKTVIVSAVQQDKQYVRIRRMCDGNDNSCVPSANYYCPDGCYEISTVVSDGGAVSIPEIAAGTPPALPPETLAAESEPADREEESIMDSSPTAAPADETTEAEEGQ